MKITYFNKGDLIIKVEPRIINNNFTSFHDYSYSYPTKDTSYIGEKFELVDIKNGLAYVYTEDDNRYNHKNNIVEIDLQQYNDGWNYYIEPDLTVLSKNNSIKNFMEKLDQVKMLDLDKLDDTEYEAVTYFIRSIKNILNKYVQ